MLNLVGETRFILGKAMDRMELLQIDVLLIQEELMPSKETIGKPHRDFRVLIAATLSVKTEALDPQSEVALVFGNCFRRTLKNALRSSSVKRGSSGSIHMRKMETKKFVENSKTIATIGVFTHDSIKDWSSSEAVTSNNSKATMNGETEFLVSIDPMSMSRPFWAVAVGHVGMVNR
jgi:hypothetical protein